MKIFVTTSIITLLAISAAAGVMPEDIQATASAIADNVEVTLGVEVMSDQPEPTFKEKLDGLIQFAFTAIFILL